MMQHNDYRHLILYPCGSYRFFPPWRRKGEYASAEWIGAEKGWSRHLD